MRVCSISLDGFRNYTQFSAQFSPGVNVIWGENAQGKTNLLEAIGFLAGARSHRARGDKELIAFQRTQGTITAQVESRGRDFLIQAQLFRGARRKLFVNHVKLKTAGELSEILQTVLFCPEDLALIKAGAAERRTFLDRAICQLRPRYAEALSQYQKLLDHKTRILRDWEKNPSLLEVLEDFNEAMARAGALVIHYRAHFIRKLAEKAQVIQREFSGGGEELALSYQTVRTVTDPLGPTVTLYEALREHQNSHRRAELEAKSVPLRPPQGRSLGGHQRAARPAVCLPGADPDRRPLPQTGRAGDFPGGHRPVAHPPAGRCALRAGSAPAGLCPGKDHRRAGVHHRLPASGGGDVSRKQPAHCPRYPGRCWGGRRFGLNPRNTLHSREDS